VVAEVVGADDPHIRRRRLRRRRGSARRGEREWAAHVQSLRLGGAQVGEAGGPVSRAAFETTPVLQRIGSPLASLGLKPAKGIGLGATKRALEESAAIKASEARFRALLEAEPNAILALDENDRVTWATRQAGELFGAPAVKLVGVPLSELVVLPH